MLLNISMLGLETVWLVLDNNTALLVYNPLVIAMLLLYQRNMVRHYGNCCFTMNIAPYHPSISHGWCVCQRQGGGCMWGAWRFFISVVWRCGYAQQFEHWIFLRALRNPWYDWLVHWFGMTPTHCLSLWRAPYHFGAVFNPGWAGLFDKSSNIKFRFHAYQHWHVLSF